MVTQSKLYEAARKEMLTPTLFQERLIPGETVIAPNGGDVSLYIEVPCRHSLWRRLWDAIRRREHPSAHYAQVGSTLAALSGDLVTIEWDAAGNLKVKP